MVERNLSAGNRMCRDCAGHKEQTHKLNVTGELGLLDVASTRLVGLSAVESVELHIPGPGVWI